MAQLGRGVVEGQISSMTEFSFYCFITPVPIKSFLNFLNRKAYRTGKFCYFQNVQQGSVCLAYIWEMC